MSRFKVEHIPNFTEYKISSTTLWSKMPKCQLYLWDSRYWYVSHEDWGKIFDDVLLNMPKYVADKVDCENMAFHASSRVNEKYHLNTCGIAIGDSPMGYHGFNIFLSEAGLFYLEPQTGEVFSIAEDSGYKAEIIILG